MTRSALLACAAALCLLAPGVALAQNRVSIDLPDNAARAAAPAARAVSFAAEAGAPGGTLILPMRPGDTAAGRAPMLSEAERRMVDAALTSAAFEGRARRTETLRGIGEWDRIIVVGVGDASDLAAVQLSGAVVGRLLVSDMAPATLSVQGLPANVAAELTTGFGIGHYRSDLYSTTREAGVPGGLSVVGDAAAGAEPLYRGRGQPLVEAMTWTRDIANEPANSVYPQTFVERAQAAFRGVDNVSIEVLDEAAMQRLGMGAILGVGRGSHRPPRMLIVRYQGAGGQPVVLAGKGITFDTGGISLKPGAGMGNMKMDMSGAAGVVGATLALAKSQAPVNVVAIAALAENMPDGQAIRPADVLTAMDGTTIEIISTDAEGRLVLADAIAWAEANLDPAVIVDMATLTGSVGGALGGEYAGLFSRHDALAQQLVAAGRAAGEGVWQLPLHPSYAADIASTIADIQNTGGSGAGAGTGAHFIGHFVEEDTPWAHIDMANMAYGGANDWKPDGSFGYGVRLLERFVRDYQPVPAGRAEGGR
ncbi:M17 family metallopeptidase [Brevundimonas sp.]|uniref:leucyl aminopeptidase family protein n=1 Tax=Brevundimonas sp. TaxID=1871086 RepID=UPI0035B3CB03